MGQNKALDKIKLTIFYGKRKDPLLNLAVQQKHLCSEWKRNTNREEKVIKTTDFSKTLNIQSVHLFKHCSTFSLNEPLTCCSFFSMQKASMRDNVSILCMVSSLRRFQKEGYFQKHYFDIVQNVCFSNVLCLIITIKNMICVTI